MTKEEKRSYDLEYRRVNKEKIAAYWRAYNLAHKEENSARDKVRYQKKREEIRAKQAVYRETHKEEIKTMQAAYARAHPEVYATHRNRRRARKIGNGGNHTVAERVAKFAEWFNRCYYCGVSGRLEGDHNIPLIRGGTDSIDNILPCCKSCNSKKGTRTAAEYLEKIGLPRLVGF